MSAVVARPLLHCALQVEGGGEAGKGEEERIWREESQKGEEKKH